MPQNDERKLPNMGEHLIQIDASEQDASVSDGCIRQGWGNLADASAILTTYRGHQL